MTTQKAKTYWSLPGVGCSQELNHSGLLQEQVQTMYYIEDNMLYAISELAWENSRHLPTLKLVSPPINDVSEMSTETPYWWCLTIQMWVVLLTGWIKFNLLHAISELQYM